LDGGVTYMIKFHEVLMICLEPKSFTYVTKIMNIVMFATDFGSVWKKSSFRIGIICPKNQALSSLDGCLIFAKPFMCKVSKKCFVRIWVYELLTFIFLTCKKLG
jgi:hypothetical protein